MRLVDLYLLRRLLIPFAASLIVIVLILSLENMSRLLLVVKDVSSPLALLARFMLFLLPEYAGIGLLIALFLSVALAIRSASLAGEWQVFSAIGLSPLRLLLVPLALASLTAGAQLALRFHLQPAGERRLDQLAEEVARGLHGFGGPAGEIVPLGSQAYAAAGGVDPRSGEMRGLFLARDGIVFTARSARLGFDGSGALLIRLRHGDAFAPVDGAHRHLAFRSYEMRLPVTGQPLRHSTADRLDRLSARPLLDRAAEESDRASQPALAALASRCTYAAFCLIIPLLAAALGRPPLRGTRAAALGVGLLLIAGFVRSAAFVEARFPHRPLIAPAIHLALWATAAIWLWRLEQRRGPGAVEAGLERLAHLVLRRLRHAFSVLSGLRRRRESPAAIAAE